MSDRFAVVETWPELFEGLTETQHHAVVKALVAGWHEGWKPSREDVGDVTDYARGAITMDEFEARSLAKAKRESSSVRQNRADKNNSSNETVDGRL